MITTVEEKEESENEEPEPEENGSDKEKLERQLIENLQRGDLSVEEKGNAYKRLLNLVSRDQPSKFTPKSLDEGIRRLERRLGVSHQSIIEALDFIKEPEENGSDKEKSESEKTETETVNETVDESESDESAEDVETYDDSTNKENDDETKQEDSTDEDSFVLPDQNDISSLLGDYDIEEKLREECRREKTEISDQEIKSMNNWLWGIVKSLTSKKISTDTVKQVLLRLKWELLWAKNEQIWLKSLLNENQSLTDKIEKEKEMLQKQLDDTKSELTLRKKTISDLTNQKVEDLDKMRTQPESFGYLLTKNQFHILKALDESEKGMTYTQLKEFLVLNQNSKQMSNQTMNDNLKALVSKQALGFAEHNDNGIYSINDAGRLALNSSKGNI